MFSRGGKGISLFFHFAADGPDGTDEQNAEDGQNGRSRPSSPSCPPKKKTVFFPGSDLQFRTVERIFPF